MAKIIDGKLLAKKTRDRVAAEIEVLISKGRRKPCLAVILVGDDPASEIYVARKKTTCEILGIDSKSFSLPQDCDQDVLYKLIDELNNNDEVDGILLQLPLPPQIDKIASLAAISRDKDVDGISPNNEGRLVWQYPGFYPCTPLGIMELIQSEVPNLKGKVAAVVGRSGLVGRPTGTLLENAGCTIIGLHSMSKDTAYWARQAEILVVATGVRHLVDQEWVHKDSVVIDVGIHRFNNGLCGDVDFEAVFPIVKAITPVPGGVGPMTIAMLMHNVLRAYLFHMGLVAEPTSF